MLYQREDIYLVEVTVQRNRWERQASEGRLCPTPVYPLYFVFHPTTLFALLLRCVYARRKGE